MFYNIFMNDPLDDALMRVLPEGVQDRLFEKDGLRVLIQKRIQQTSRGIVRRVGFSLCAYLGDANNTTIRVGSESVAQQWQVLEASTNYTQLTTKDGLIEVRKWLKFCETANTVYSYCPVDDGPRGN